MAPKPEEHVQKDPEVGPKIDGERVVISGMSGLYPRCHNVKEFSNVLYNKEDPISIVKSRWQSKHPEVSKYLGIIPDLNRFDAQFFKVTYRLGNSMDSMSRKILEQTFQAIYDAGLSPDDLDGKKVAVFTGACFSETEKASFYVASTRTGFGIVGCNKSMFSNRISYWLNLKGPSMCVDDSCSSSTIALMQAHQAIARGDCEAAIVTGSNLFLHPQSSLHTGRVVPNAYDGKTKSFDANADGCVKSETVQVLFLQKAQHALRIYAEVVYVDTMYASLPADGEITRFGFYRDPAITTEFLKKFYDGVNIPPQAVEYVEAFGTGCLEADKAEIDAIDAVFCKGRKEPLPVGSVISNIGYTEASSGLTSVAKAILAYYKCEIAPNMNYTNPPEDVKALREGRIRIVTEPEPFRGRYIAINNLSITGCTSHILLAGYYKPKDLERYKSSIPRLVTVSARQESSVKKILEDLKSRPIDAEELALFHNIHSSVISGHLGRGFIILDTNEEQKTVSLAESVEYFDNARRPLWFVYSGMGSQWAGMGVHLMRIPIFAAAIERCHRVLAPKGIDLVHIITSPDKTIFDNILHSFVGIAAVQIGLTDVLRELGLVPDKIIGHSVGELGCAYADGCFTAEEMILSAYSRGLVSIQTPFIKGSMAAVGIGYEKVKDMIPPEIEVACHNSSESSTISGPAEVMKEFVASLTAKGIFAKEVPCSNIAYHSRYIAEAGPGLLKYLSEVIKNPKPRSERWVSTSVPFDRWDEPAAKLSSAEYHTNNLLNPVLFEETSSLIPADAVLVEIAPHGLLQAILKRSLPSSCKHIPLTRRGHPNNALMVLDGIGKLYMEGYNPKLDVLYPKVEFPVSTGTPMLSHLVEWAHNERWSLPIFVAALTKTAAATQAIISLHDDEYSYLRGNTVRGKIILPCAVSLVAVWDTLAMTLGQKKKQISVEFEDLQFFSQPILHDQKKLKIHVAINRGNGRFEVMEENSKVASGYVKPKPAPNKNLSKKTLKSQNESGSEKIFDADDIYQMMYERGFNYSGEFRNIYNAAASLTEANLIWNDNWITMIEGMLQLNALRQKHNGVSQTFRIRTMSIDIVEHRDASILEFDGKTTMKTSIDELYDYTRCGGILMENIKFCNLPSVNSETALLTKLQFVPFIQNAKSDVKTILQVYLQMVAENINKNVIKVVELTDGSKANTVYKSLNNILNEIPGVRVQLTQIAKEDVYKDAKNLAEADVVLVQHISMEDNICQLLYNNIKQDTFVVSIEDSSRDSLRVRPESLYRVIASQNLGVVWLHLLKWRPTVLSESTTAFTVRTPSDLSFLRSTREHLPKNHKLLVVTSYPPVDGVKELIGQWRKESDRNQVYMVMVNHRFDEDQDMINVPELDLAFNVLENGNWGGEYYVPIKEKPSVAPFTKLHIKDIGDLNTLSWVEDGQSSTTGIPVKVHYASLNTLDSKKATGIFPINKENNFEDNSFGMDFSGVTESGVKVMGIVPGGAASSVVRASPNLLWPVPSHWTLEDAATVPLAYVQAFYILVLHGVKFVNEWKQKSILIHGGAGALGQAMISLAFSLDFDVFTTVSDVRKKHFLRKLFPGLREDHIGNSRDASFSDMVLSKTKGKGVFVVVLNGLEGDLRNVSLNSVGSFGHAFDTVLLKSNETYSYGMNNMTGDRHYHKIDFSSVFNEEMEMKKLQLLMSHGIARGIVRPLSRVTYLPHEVSRAFRLLQASQHRGRVLLRMCDAQLSPYPRLVCNGNQTQIVVSNDDYVGLQLVDRLVKRGAKKVILHLPRLPAYVLLKKQSWESLGVEVKITADEMKTIKEISTLLKEGNSTGAVEGIHFVSTTASDNKTKQELLTALDVSSRKLCPSIKYFTVLSNDRNFGDETCIARAKDQLPATKLTVPKIRKMGDVDQDCSVSVQTAVDMLERAARSAQTVVFAQKQNETKTTLLEKIMSISEIKLPEDVSKNIVLEDLKVPHDKVQRIAVLLRDEYNLCMSEENILSLSIEQIQKIEESTTQTEVKQKTGLDVFFSHFDTDEINATTDIVLIPTLTSSTTIEEELDATQSYLVVVPGMEGHNQRFRELCERIKMPALVLQTGLDYPDETVPHMAERMAQVLLKKVSVKERFYLLGYETGILVALEMAAILERHGLTGIVYCIGTTPDRVKHLVANELKEFDSDEELQKGIINHMYHLMTGSNIEVDLDNTLTFKEKIDKCVRVLLKKMPMSAQYARAQFTTAYGRIHQTLNFKPEPFLLQSKIVLLHAPIRNQPMTSADSFQQYSRQPIAVHELDNPLPHALNDLRCATIINKHLDPELLDIYNNRNQCEKYLLSSETFMNTQDLDIESFDL